MAQVFIILSSEVAGSVLVTPHPDTGEARPGEGSGRFCKVLSVVSLGQSQSALTSLGQAPPASLGAEAHSGLGLSLPQPRKNSRGWQ